MFGRFINRCFAKASGVIATGTSRLATQGATGGQAQRTGKGHRESGKGVVSIAVSGDVTDQRPQRSESKESQTFAALRPAVSVVEEKERGNSEGFPNNKESGGWGRERKARHVALNQGSRYSVT